MSDTQVVTTTSTSSSTTAALPTFSAVVADVCDVAPNVRSVELVVNPSAFRSLGGDQFVYVMVPRAAGGKVPPGWTMADQLEADTDSPLTGAYYTIRSWDPSTARLVFWAVRHRHTTGVGAWAERCRPGDELVLWGPRAGVGAAALGGRPLLVTDESGFGAVAALLDSLPAASAPTVIAETIDGAHEVDFGGVGVSWVHRHGGRAGGELLLDAVRASSLDTAGLVVWGAGERRVMSALRKHLRHERGMPAADVHVTGYWRRRP